jgi:hypothetical protein
MRYNRYLILFLLFIGGLSPVFAQETRYRVEILVLRHLEQNEEPMERLELPDFSMATDFLTPAVENADESDETPDASDITEQPLNELAEGDTLENADLGEPPLDPNRLVHIEEMSSVMQETWRRLRLSGPFRPEQYLSWEQGSQEPFPSLRVHDLSVVMIVDPWAEFRPQAGETATVFADAPGLNAAADNSGFEGPQLPDPVTYYRLDGTVALRRSRFLHLDLDLQFREPVWQQEVPGALETRGPDARPAQPSSFRVYALKQSRQVRTGRMEYFDGPFLGVLAWITEVEEESGETP